MAVPRMACRNAASTCKEKWSEQADAEMFHISAAMLFDRAEVLDQDAGFTTEHIQANVIVFVSPFPLDKNQARRKNRFFS